MLGLSTIIKLTMGLIVIFVVFGIVHTLFPDALKSFSEATHIEFPTFSFGKEKQQSDFEVPEKMEENIDEIYQTISKIKDKDVAPGTKSEEIIGEPFEFNDFGGCQLTIKNKDGKLRMIVNFGDKTEFYDYKDIEYNPCIIKIDDKKFAPKASELLSNLEYKSDDYDDIPRDKYLEAIINSLSNVQNVKKIVFISKYKFKVNDDNELFRVNYNLIKTENNNLCFVYHDN